MPLPIKRRPVPLRSSQQGFTLIELLFVVATATIILALSAPALRAAIDGQRLIAAADDISSTLAEARREAIRTSRQSTVAIDAVARTVTYSAFSDAAGTLVQRRFVGLPNGVTLVAVPATVIFDPLGRPTAVLALIALTSAATGRVLTVRVLPTGRIEVL